MTISDPQVMRALAHPARIAIMEYLSTPRSGGTATEWPRSAGCRRARPATTCGRWPSPAWSRRRRAGATRGSGCGARPAECWSRPGRGPARRRGRPSRRWSRRIRPGTRSGCGRGCGTPADEPAEWYAGPGMTALLLTAEELAGVNDGGGRRCSGRTAAAWRPRDGRPSRPAPARSVRHVADVAVSGLSNAATSMPEVDQPRIGVASISCEALFSKYVLHV